MNTATESITLTPAKHGKLGLLHCGVTREGFIAVAGDTANIADGEDVTFTRCNITVRRNGSEYVFTRNG